MFFFSFFLFSNFFLRQEDVHKLTQKVDPDDTGLISKEDFIAAIEAYDLGPQSTDVREIGLGDFYFPLFFSVSASTDCLILWASKPSGGIPNL